MGLDRPGISPRPTKRLRKQKQRSLDEQRRASSQTTRRTSKPRPAAVQARPLVRVRPKAVLVPLAVPRSLAEAKDQPKGLRVTDPSKLPKNQHFDRKVRKHSGVTVVGDASGIARALGHAGRAVVETTVDDPVGAARKTLSTGAEIAKGAAGAAIALPVYTAKYNAQIAVGDKPKGDSPVEIAGRMVKGEIKRVSKTYGPSYRGEKGAYPKLKAKVKREGPLLTALDVATAAAPLSSGAGAAARTVARTTGSRTAAKVAAKTTSRPPLKTVPLKPGTPQHVRKSAVGAGGAAAIDAARRAAQAAAKARSTERLRVRAVKRVTGKNIARKRPEGKPSVLNTVPKPLTARRAGLRADEVAPITRLSANRHVRMRVAKVHTRGDAAAKHRIKRSTDELAGAFKGLPEELHHAALKAAQLGIRDSRSAPGILRLRIAEAERARAAAKASRSDPNRKAEAHAEGDPGELDRLKGLLANPAVFDDPRVLAAAETVGRVGRRVGPREALNPERAAVGRAGLVGQTLGVKTAKQTNAERRAAYDAGVKQSAVKVSAARAEVERQQRAAGTARLLTREAAIGKGMGGKIRVSDPATLKSISRHEQKLARRGPLNRVAGHGEAVVRHERGLRVAKQELRAARDEAAQARRAGYRREHESPSQYEARVVAASKERNLAAPEHVVSAFERDPVPTAGIAGARAPANPLARKRKGILYGLAREDTKPLDVVQNTAAKLRRGAKLEAESKVLAEHGLPFHSVEEAADHARKLGLNMDDARGTVEMLVRKPSMGMVSKSIPGVKPRKGSDSDAGDYVKTDDVFLMSKQASDQLDALDVVPSKPGEILQKLAHYPQAALLALSPSWFQFQRVNDLIALGVGGALPHVASYRKMLKQLAPDEREIVHTMSGGSISSTLLEPTSLKDMGRLQRVLDETPIYKRAFGGQNPATVLLRADQAITGRARELQYLHNLSQTAKKLDAPVGAVAKTFAPLGHAFKTADVEMVRKLLNDPKYAAKLEDAAEQLYKIHGDWHNFTAAERRFKGGAAFYGFLRYATRMALLTLPLNHPYVGLLIAQLGSMGAQDAKRIIGPDIPYGLSALYNKDRTVAIDFTRANPLAGPLTGVTKPEQIPALATPLAGIVLNYMLGQNVAFNESSIGRAKTLVGSDAKGRGDPEQPIGPATGEQRMRYGLDQVLSLLSPYREWKRFDSRAQSDDSLPWDRRYLVGSSASRQATIEERNARSAGKGGKAGLVHNIFPIFAPGSGENVGEKGDAITKARRDASRKSVLRRAKREYSLDDPVGAIDRYLETLDEKVARATSSQDEYEAELDQYLKLLDARIGK